MKYRYRYQYHLPIGTGIGTSEIKCRYWLVPYLPEKKTPFCCAELLHDTPEPRDQWGVAVHPLNKWIQSVGSKGLISTVVPIHFIVTRLVRRGLLHRV